MFFKLDDKIVGESEHSKINRLFKVLNKNKSDYLFVTAPENVAWLLNIRGHDNPNSPIPNCQLIIKNKKSFYLISSKYKVSKLINEKFNFSTSNANLKIKKPDWLQIT